MKLYEVAVVAPLPKTLTYCEPPESTGELLPGQRVLVPLGKRLTTGYVLGSGQDGETEREYVVKPIR